MFKPDILQDQWVILALISGVIAVFMMVISYIAIWRPRREEEFEKRTGKMNLVGLMRVVPWILIFTFISVIVFGIVAAIDKAFNPPNW